MALVPLQRTPKNFSLSTVEDTMRPPRHQNCEKKGIIVKLLAYGMYVTAAEQTKAPSDRKEIFLPWEVWGRGGRGKVVLRAERLRC